MFAYNSTTAQDTLKLSLSDVVELAKSQSLQAKSAAVRKMNAEWEWKLFRSELKPKLNMNLSALNFQQSVEAITQQDGSIRYQEVTQNRSNATLEIQQLVPFTGGNFFVRTNLERFDNLSKDEMAYGGSPLEIGLQQPLFAYNHYKWQKRLAPIRFEESKKNYSAGLEEVAFKAVQLYFNLSLNQINKEIAQTNLKTNESILKIAEEKYRMGKISKDEYLQAKVLLKNAEIAAISEQMQNTEAVNELRTHLAVKENIGIQLILPEKLPLQSLNFDEVWNVCQHNSTELIRQQRRLLEVQQEEARVRGQTGISGKLKASLGYSAQSEDLPTVLDNTNSLQMIGLQFSIPILDWGEAKAKRKTVEAKKMLVEQNIEQEKADFKQQIRTLVGAYNTLKQQAVLAQAAKELAEERFAIAKGRYIASDIKLIDLNLAMTQKDGTNRSYVNTLRDFWLTSHKIRTLSLYDFISKQNLLN